MRENKVTNILFIVFTVMALAGTASLVKTAIAPKENMQETEQKVIPEKPTGEPVPAQAMTKRKIRQIKRNSSHQISREKMILMLQCRRNLRERIRQIPTARENQ